MAHVRTVGSVAVPMTVGLLALSLAAYVTGQPAPARPTPATEASALAGTWKLNPDLSENFHEKMRQARGGDRGGRPGGRPGGGRGGRQGGGGRGGGFGGGVGGPGGGGGMPGEPGGPPPEGRESMRRLAEPSDVLTIKTEGEAVLVADDMGTVRRLYPDGRTMKTDNGEGQVRTRWEREGLVAETIPSRGPRYKETFALSADRQQLLVIVHLEPPKGGAVDVKRVYDAAR